MEHSLKPEKRALVAGDLTLIDLVTLVGYFNMLESSISFGIETISWFNLLTQSPTPRKSNLVKNKISISKTIIIHITSPK